MLVFSRLKIGEKMRKRIILTIFSMIILGCTPIQRYDKVFKKGYKNSRVYKDFEEKVLDESNIYYKLDKKIRKTHGEELRYFVEKIGEELILYLSIKYRGKDWLYMKAIEFENESNNESYLLDFYEHKLYKALWKDKTTWSLKVEEYLAFPLNMEEIKEINKYLTLEDVKITLYSDYDERNHVRGLSQKEKEYMLKTFAFYQDVKEEMLKRVEEQKEDKVIDKNMEEFLKEQEEGILYEEESLENDVEAIKANIQSVKEADGEDIQEEIEGIEEKIDNIGVLDK